MARGGRRPGAGRPPLAFERRFVIGGECEELWRRAIDLKARQEIDRRTRTVRNQWKKAVHKPIRTRRAWTQTREFKEDYLEDVRGAMQEDQGIDAVEEDRDPDRLYVICPPRPKNLRRRIIREVATLHRITERMVVRCWEEYRRLEEEGV